VAQLKIGCENVAVVGMLNQIIEGLGTRPAGTALERYFDVAFLAREERSVRRVIGRMLAGGTPDRDALALLQSFVRSNAVQAFAQTGVVPAHMGNTRTIPITDNPEPCAGVLAKNWALLYL
jgi:hypothetical protein